MVRKLSSLKRSCGAFRPYAKGYAGQGWRNGVPPEFGRAPPSAALSLNGNPESLRRWRVLRGEKEWLAFGPAMSRLRVENSRF